MPLCIPLDYEPNIQYNLYSIYNVADITEWVNFDGSDPATPQEITIKPEDLDAAGIYRLGKAEVREAEVVDGLIDK